MANKILVEYGLRVQCSVRHTQEKCTYVLVRPMSRCYKNVPAESDRPLKERRGIYREKEKTHTLSPPPFSFGKKGSGMSEHPTSAAEGRRDEPASVMPKQDNRFNVCDRRAKRSARPASVMPSQRLRCNVGGGRVGR